ncbi:hypothetical protein K469DRAFT_686858 [Zopfia rhizophila CBS 207.26]|uniref:F-box domain-containing protein n=1 Tax=Zopfia rhizophila CBS 207.26 TaxID=1314779 RepID=A0A6A6E8G6_9PEZI|nr:hypothetical protein K469DRAFT_686858 [Zopfia rhizophila CBS 207.26]
MHLDEDFPPLPSKRNSNGGNSVDSKRANPVLNAVKPKWNNRAFIMDLPTELLLLVLENFDPDQFRQTLVSLSQTNRRFHGLVMEKLYSKYASSIGSPYLFLRTMVTTPRAAEKVKTLAWSYGSRESDSDDESYGRCYHHNSKVREKYNPTVSDRGLIKNRPKAVDIPGWKKFATKCNNYCDEQEEILFAAVLMQTANIETLEIEDGPTPYQVPRWMDLIRHTASGNSFGRIHSFKHLRSVRIIRGFMHLADISPLFRLQSMRTLSLEEVMETAHDAKWNIPPCTSLIEELYLYDCLILPETLAGLVSCCRKLTVFEYVSVDANVNTQVYRLGHALQRHSHALKSLLLADGFFSVSQHYSAFWLSDSLRHYEKLTRVAVPLSALVDKTIPRSCTLADRLPACLRRLELNVGSEEPASECEPVIKHLANSSSTYLPLLEEVTISIDSIPIHFKLDWKRLRDAFSASGVAFNFRYR